MRKAEVTEDEYREVAAALEIEYAALRAVVSVESSGNGFLSTGEPTILFERHWMYKLLKQKGITPVISSVCNPTPGGYRGGAYEHQRLQEAVKIDRDAALQACSWGEFQIMGFHWKTLGYESLQAFVNAMFHSEHSQLDAFVRFVKANPVLLKALRTKNWVVFARVYNGPAYAKNQYDVKLARAYERWSKT